MKTGMIILFHSNDRVMQAGRCIVDGLWNFNSKILSALNEDRVF